MDIAKVLAEYDALEATHDLEAINNFLDEKLSEAKAEGDTSSAITLYNEIIGFNREISDYAKSITACRDLLITLEEAGLNGTVSYATCLLNIANACRAAGLLQESMAYYNETLRIYDENLEPTDFSYAPLYNNLALLFQEMGDFESASGTLRKALSLALSQPGEDIKVAISHTNLAMSLLKNGEYGEAMDNLTEAFKIFDSKPEPDYHYGAALSAMAEAKYVTGEYEESAEYYERALKEIRKNTGYSQAYDITLANLHQASEKAMEARKNEAAQKGEEYKGIKGLELSKAFYEEYGKPMIEEKFPLYRDLIAVGLCGEGSECLGYDDDVSSDHDFGPGFQMWLPGPIYDEIGAELQAAYEELPIRYKGYTRLTTREAGRRVGVFEITEWYAKILGMDIRDERGDINYVENHLWMALEDCNLNKATNGEVFTDSYGEFSKIRKILLNYYPDSVWRKKIATELTKVSQYGQYNYERVWGRGDKVSATICLGSFIEHTMKLVYLLNRQYAPIYKWLSKGMEKQDIFIKSNLEKISENLNDFTGNKKLIEEIALDIVGKLKNLGLSELNDSYLAHHDVISGADTKADLVNTIVRLEWVAFDKAHNEGGRADCQDNWTTCEIMRKSQYLTWTEEMLESYIADFKAANAAGWNLIAEKYGRMEESTAPERWNEIKDRFPPISDEKKAIIESIVQIQVGMMEDFAREFPDAAKGARSIHTSEDTEYNTSYETYLRGELSTYSDNTLILYGRFIAGLAAEGRNLAKMIITNTARLMQGA